jgi:5-(carboxyamino)imidazole ribonucleotide mutase
MMKVLILVGSGSDHAVMGESSKYLDYSGIENELAVASAHRTPDRVSSLAASAARQGFGLIITAAGMAAALPGLVAARTPLPVLGRSTGGRAIPAARIFALTDEKVAERVEAFRRNGYRL